MTVSPVTDEAVRRPALMRNITRRDFLKVVGTGAASLWWCQFPLKHLVALEQEPESWPLGIEHFVQSVCDQCPSACGVIGRVVDGKLTKLDGNPRHPTNRGKLCPVGQAGVQLLYNPDRLRHPLEQSPKGSGQWRAVSWDDAINAIVGHLRGLRSRGSPESHAILTGEREGDFDAMMKRFMRSFGSPNYFMSLSARAARTANFLMQGTYTLPSYDFERANLILSFGAPLLENWHSPMQSQRAYGYLRQARRGPRARLIQVEPRFSMTSAKADQWVPIRPGTEAALALGIAYVLIKEHLYDEDFVKHHTFGFDDWQSADGSKHRGFMGFVLEHYRPERVADITGLSVLEIVTLAKELARATPVLAVGGGVTSLYSNATITEMAIDSLNALLGSIEIPGGVIHQRKVEFAPLPEVRPDAIALGGLEKTLRSSGGESVLTLSSNNPETLLESLLSGDPYRITSLWIIDENPVFSGVFGNKWREALKRIPLVVAFSTFMTETAELADFVLPHPTFMERGELINAPAVSSVPVIGLMQPIVKPLYETRHVAQVVLDIAHRVDKTLADDFPWNTVEDFQGGCLEQVFRERRGTMFTDSFEEEHIKLLEERGYWSPTHASPQAFQDDFKKNGGWWDPHYPMQRWGSVFKTKSHQFEFFPQAMADGMEHAHGRMITSGHASNLAKDLLLKRIGLAGEDGEIYLPHYESMKVSGDQASYPFFLMLYQPLTLTALHSANLPWLQEYLVAHLPMRWGSWVEVNPETARQLHLRNQQLVWVESPHGRVKLELRTYAGSMPGVVSCILGQGHTSLGRWARGCGENPLQLVGEHLDSLAGSPALLSTRVKLYQA